MYTSSTLTFNLAKLFNDHILFQEYTPLLSLILTNSTENDN